MGALITSSHCQLRWVRTVPPSRGPSTKPDMPTIITTVIERIRSFSSSKSRKISDIVTGAIAAAASPRAARRAMS